MRKKITFGKKAERLGLDQIDREYREATRSLTTAVRGGTRRARHVSITEEVDYSPEYEFARREYEDALALAD